jgi:hypothetical protein
LRPRLTPQALTFTPPPFEVPSELSDSQWQMLCALWADPPRTPSEAHAKLNSIYPNLRSAETLPTARLWDSALGNPFAASCFWLLVALQPRDAMSAHALLLQRQMDAPLFARAAAATLYIQLFIRPDPTQETPWGMVADRRLS